MDNLSVNKHDLHIRQVIKNVTLWHYFFCFHLYKLKKASEKKTHGLYFEDTQQHSQLLRKYPQGKSMQIMPKRGS